MLTRLDDVIYPNRCEVIEIEPSQRYIYSIFKNASSSINEYAREQKYRILFNEQLKRIDVIDVILRDPESRLISGVNTYVVNLLKENPALDRTTIIYFINEYLFLNRHYSTQLSWLLNLFRYIDSTKIRFRSMNNVSEYTPLTINPQETTVLTSNEITQLTTNKYNEMYLRLDNKLMELIDKGTWDKRRIMQHLMISEPQAYFDTIGKCNTILGNQDVLS
jgi:hypothetical protein